MTYYNQRTSRAQNSRPAHKQRNNRQKSGRKAQSIHPSKFINKNVKSVAIAAYEPEHVFSDFGFDDALQRNIDAAGFVAPSAIQDTTIPFALQGRDVIGLANTGTGKTAAFLLPILQKLSQTRAPHSALVIAPTRELAQQIEAEFRKFAAGMKLYSALIVGGASVGSQIYQLNRTPHLIIGTPGRLKDMLNRGVLKTDKIDTFVLDEADRMLDMGFVNDIRELASILPPERQTLCFSATMSEGVKKITHEFMLNPELVSVKVTETNEHIYQDIVEFHNDDHKKDLLLEMLQQEDFEKVIIFGETKFGVQRLSDKLEKDGISAQAIHGNKSQSQRNRALRSFKQNEAKVLVATDVAARGLDIPSVSHVINFDIPQTYDDYVHRIGRTGRGGKAGIALTFVKKY